MEDIYLKFFEDVLEVNEEINVSFVQDYPVSYTHLDVYKRQMDEVYNGKDK